MVPRRAAVVADREGFQQQAQQDQQN